MKRKAFIGMLAAVLSLALCVFGAACGISEAEQGVAEIDGVQYNDLQAAFDAAKDGDTVKLLADYTIAEDVEDTAEARLVINSKITLDFGSYRIIAPAKMSEYGKNFTALYIKKSTIFKANENGGIVCELSEDGIGPYGVNITDEAEVTITGGTYVGGGTAFQVQLGKLEILGGKFSCNPFDAPYGYNFLINCIDSAYKNGTAVVGIKGGSFANFNPANCKAEGENTNFVADGYTVEDLGETVEYRYVVKAAELTE